MIFKICKNIQVVQLFFFYLESLLFELIEGLKKKSNNFRYRNIKFFLVKILYFLRKIILRDLQFSKLR